MPHDAAAAPDRAVPLIDGLSGLVGRYDALILDLWGVLHNGLEPYPGVLDCLRALKSAGKRTCLLSNAPRRVHSVVEQLDGIGIPRALYGEALSSGEATWQALAEPPDEFHRSLGRRCFHLGPPRDASAHEGLDLDLVGRPEDAGFVLNTGAHEWDDTLEDYRPTLEAAAARDLPMICANPDLVVMYGAKEAICAGLLAREYERMGGRVAYHGKPHPPVYRRCLGLLGDPSPSSVLAIGDSLRTDVAGAAAAGIDAVFVTGGIHGEALGCGPDGTPDPDRLARAIAESPARPIAAVRRFVW
jgi:HAD superfamily hydrolase (TIGR01459 family)